MSYKRYLLPIRRLHGKLNNIYLDRLNKRRIKNSISRTIGEKKFYIPGTPTHTNLGDSAIVLAQKCFLKKCGIEDNRIIEITFEEYYKYRKMLRKKIGKENLIASLGGGNMGNQWPKEEIFRYDLLSDFKDNPTIIFPQTIHYIDTADRTAEQKQKESIEHYDKKEKLVIVARERTSYDTMRMLYKNTKLMITPDIVLSTTMKDYGVASKEREGVLLCMRNDVEKSVSDSDWEKIKNKLKLCDMEITITDMHTKEQVTKENRAKLVKKKMQEFCNTRMVITDRLHGMIFSAITETPCIVLSNYNHKVYGTYEWIKYLPYLRYANNVEQALTYIPELLEIPSDVCKFDNDKLLPYFEQLKAEIKFSVRK